MVLSILQIFTAVLLIVVILLQVQGAGISGAFGGGMEVYRSKRSFEKFLIWATVVLTTLFALFSLLQLRS